MLVLEFGGWEVAEVQAVGVEPADVFDDRELELHPRAPDPAVISSVLKESTKLSAIALSNASPTEPIDPG